MGRCRAALAGYYGFGNLGDELLAEASIAMLARCGVERDRIVVLSNDPGDSKRRFGTDAVSRWRMTAVLGALRRSDTLLLGGGGLFQDATSLRSCLYYWGLVRAARRCGAIPWALGQSVGPLSTQTGRFLARDALRRCRVVQVRDESSRALCEAMGLSVEIGRDLVLSLGDALRSKMIANPNGDPLNGNLNSFMPKFLLNLRPFTDGLPERFARAVSEGTLFFGASPVGVALADEDEALIRRLMERGDLPAMPIERLRNLDDAARIWSGAVGAMGMRLHFSVLSALAGIPLIAVPYDPKVAAFASEHNVPLWIDGPLPAPQVPDMPRDFSAEFAATEAICREVLE